jgi:aerobic-type carbon monoxide dehydrogenase small subunit (CoxS/CutS family)
MITITVNGRQHSIETNPHTPLLWILRDELGMTGTKFGCGMAQCGACTVHLDGEPIRSCVTPLATAENRQVVTIEGISNGELHPVQRAWLEEDVVQCGYCQSGQIMSAVALLARNQDPDDADIDAALSGNLCRCGTYNSIRKAVKRAAARMRGEA